MSNSTTVYLDIADWLEEQGWSYAGSRLRVARTEPRKHQRAHILNELYILLGQYEEQELDSDTATVLNRARLAVQALRNLDKAEAAAAIWDAYLEDPEEEEEEEEPIVLTYKGDEPPFDPENLPEAEVSWGDDFDMNGTGWEEDDTLE